MIESSGRNATRQNLYKNVVRKTSQDSALSVHKGLLGDLLQSPPRLSVSAKQSDLKVCKDTIELRFGRQCIVGTNNAFQVTDVCI